MAHTMASLRSAALTSAALYWRQPPLRRALPGLQQHISMARTFGKPIPPFPGIPRSAGHFDACRPVASTSAVFSNASLASDVDFMSNGCQVKGGGDLYCVKFGSEYDPDAGAMGKVSWANFFRLNPSEKKKVFCEFIAQAMFNFCSCSAVAAATMSAEGNALLSTGLVMAAHMVLLPLLIFTFGPVSGAHFNPMVTATFVATRAMALNLGIAYIIAQVLGGIVGAAAAFTSLPAALQTAAYAGLNAVPADHTVLQAFMGEVYAAFVFISVLFGTVVDKRGWGRLGPIAVGLIAPLLMWIEGSVSSMCINPARAFGPAFVTGVWDNHWVFWTAPFLGGIPAALIYSKLFTAESLSKGSVDAREKAPDLILREWLTGSPHTMRTGEHLVLNFDTNPFATDREELLAHPTSNVPDISYLGIWCGEKSRLEELVRTLKPKYSIARDVDDGADMFICHGTGEFLWDGASKVIPKGQNDGLLLGDAVTAKQYGVSERESVVVDRSGHIVWRSAPSDLKHWLEKLQGRVAASQQLRTKTA